MRKRDTSMAMDSRPELPAVDEGLIVPERGYEVIGGEVVAVSPAHEPHARRHSKLAALLEACAAEGWLVASDMLTRTGMREELAPDASVYPAARHPTTGGRQLERLAFEIAVSETLAHSGRKAASLVERGVAEVFAIDVERSRALQWSKQTSSWELLPHDAVITDLALAVPLAIADVLSAAAADDALARALLAKRNGVIEAALRDTRAQGRAEAIIGVLEARAVPITLDARARILATRDEATLARWLARVASCASVDELLA